MTRYTNSQETMSFNVKFDGPDGSIKYKECPKDLQFKFKLTFKFAGLIPTDTINNENIFTE